MPGAGTCHEDSEIGRQKNDSIYHQVREFLDKGETLAGAAIG